MILVSDSVIDLDVMWDVSLSTRSLCVAMLMFDSFLLMKIDKRELLFSRELLNAIFYFAGVRSGEMLL